MVILLKMELPGAQFCFTKTGPTSANLRLVQQFSHTKYDFVLRRLGTFQETYAWFSNFRTQSMILFRGGWEHSRKPTTASAIFPPPLQFSHTKHDFVPRRLGTLQQIFAWFSNFPTQSWAHSRKPTTASAIFPPPLQFSHTKRDFVPRRLGTLQQILAWFSNFRTQIMILFHGGWAHSRKPTPALTGHILANLRLLQQSSPHLSNFHTQSMILFREGWAHPGKSSPGSAIFPHKVWFCSAEAGHIPANLRLLQQSSAHLSNFHTRSMILFRKGWAHSSKSSPASAIFPPPLQFSHTKHDFVPRRLGTFQETYDCFSNLPPTSPIFTHKALGTLQQILVWFSNFRIQIMILFRGGWAHSRKPTPASTGHIPANLRLLQQSSPHLSNFHTQSMILFREDWAHSRKPTTASAIFPPPLQFSHTKHDFVPRRLGTFQEIFAWFSNFRTQIMILFRGGWAHSSKPTTASAIFPPLLQFLHTKHDFVPRRLGTLQQILVWFSNFRIQIMILFRGGWAHSRKPTPASVIFPPPLQFSHTKHDFVPRRLGTLQQILVWFSNFRIQIMILFRGGWAHSRKPTPASVIFPPPLQFSHTKHDFVPRRLGTFQQTYDCFSNLPPTSPIFTHKA
ncbi:hypothetical protein B0H16DRAFT_1477065 [Mycena metata]|uniref:Uncharacterized protein n=1 Tax=Mycena metata TaxID=1033252 RepID=A0AAD7H9X1_9AGAR|nr:hypothetical protein B0H16DRAFT_1477065 [Mycena metata]